MDAQCCSSHSYCSVPPSVIAKWLGTDTPPPRRSSHTAGARRGFACPGSVPPTGAQPVLPFPTIARGRQPFAHALSHSAREKTKVQKPSFRVAENNSITRYTKVQKPGFRVAGSQPLLHEYFACKITMLQN